MGLAKIWSLQEQEGAVPMSTCTTWTRIPHQGPEMTRRPCDIGPTHVRHKLYGCLLRYPCDLHQIVVTVLYPLVNESDYCNLYCTAKVEIFAWNLFQQFCGLSKTHGGEILQWIWDRCQIHCKISLLHICVSGWHLVLHDIYTFMDLNKYTYIQNQKLCNTKPETL